MKQLFIAFIAVLLFSLPVCSLLAQRPAIVPAPTPIATDSTRQLRSATDSIPPAVPRDGRSGVPRSGEPVRVGSSILTPDGDSATLAGADTLRVTPKQETQIHKIIPRQATIRSLMLPGLGQAYNRQYYKIPFIYAGFGVMGYLFVRYRKLAAEAAAGYGLLLYGRQISPAQYVKLMPGSVPELLINPKKIYIPAQREKVEQVQIGDFIYRSVAGANNAYNTYRRYRDLNVILSVVLWGMNAVEANVAAHLKTFDLTDDISMRVEPSVLPMPGTGLVPGVRVALTFK